MGVEITTEPSGTPIARRVADLWVGEAVSRGDRPRTLVAEIRVRPCDTLGRAALQRSAAAASSAALLSPSLVLMGVAQGCAQLKLEVAEDLDHHAETDLIELLELALGSATPVLREAGYQIRRAGGES